MKNPFKAGDQKVYETTVTEQKLARFDSGLVHPVYSTFALGKDAEWCCRLFVLEMKEAHEEGIGSYLSIDHVSPAPLLSSLKIISTLIEVKGNEVTCEYEVFRKKVLVARGRQVQKVIEKVKFEKILEKISNT